MKVEISTVKIKVNKKTLSLTLKETQTLFDELNKIFGPKYNPFYYYPGTFTNISGVSLDTSGFADSATITSTDPITAATKLINLEK